MEKVDEVMEDPTCVFMFNNPDKVRPPVIRVEDGTFGYN
jgi:ATP-binding cassette, subfamily F, member 3